MALPPGEEDIDYNGFRLEVRRFGSGWRILIYALDGIYGLEKNPNTRQYGERNKVVAEAKALVDQHRASQEEALPHDLKTWSAPEQLIFVCPSCKAVDTKEVKRVA